MISKTAYWKLVHETVSGLNSWLLCYTQTVVYINVCCIHYHKTDNGQETKGLYGLVQPSTQEAAATKQHTRVFHACQ